MSDSAISQDEIDALLSGIDAAGSDDGFQGGGVNLAALKSFVESNAGSIKTTLNTNAGKNFEVSNPVVYEATQAEMLGKMPESILAVAADFTSGIVGDRVFVASDEFGKKLAGAINDEENPDLDEMSLSVISDVISQIADSENTALTAAKKSPGIASNPAHAQIIAKGMLRFPIGEKFVVFECSVKIDGSEYPFWEIVSQNVADAMTNALSAGNSALQTQNFNAAMPQSQGSFSMPNVQSVQYSALQNGAQGHESGNIGLIMDVFMEMTVELGRTKKQVKEILSMSEGTIIELDKIAGEPVDILVNHKPIAKGEVVVIDENFGVRVTGILSPSERVANLA